MRDMRDTRHIHPQDGKSALKKGPRSTVGIEWYCRVLGRCYTLMAATRQPYYRSLDDPRLQELRDILALVRAWHEYNAQLPDLPS